MPSLINVLLWQTLKRLSFWKRPLVPVSDITSLTSRCSGFLPWLLKTVSTDTGYTTHCNVRVESDVMVIVQQICRLLGQKCPDICCVSSWACISWWLQYYMSNWRLQSKQEFQEAGNKVERKCHEEYKQTEYEGNKQQPDLFSLLLLQRADGTCNTNFKKTKQREQVMEALKDFVDGNIQILVSFNITATRLFEI